MSERDVDHFAVVAQHGVLAEAGRQRVGAVTQQGHDVAGTDRDVVATAEVDGQAVGDADAGLAQGGSLGVVVAFGVHLHHAVVAEDGLPPGACRYGVRPHAAENRVVAVLPDLDHVTRARARRRRQHRIRGVRRLVSQYVARTGGAHRDVGHYPVVAQHDVIAAHQ